MSEGDAVGPGTPVMFDKDMPEAQVVSPVAGIVKPINRGARRKLISIALEENGNDIFGLQFYEHAETPGPGAEVENPRWKALWRGKKLADESGELQIGVTKTAPVAGQEYHIDALAGATLTSAGVSNLVNFRMGERGYGPFLDNLKTGDI